MNIDPVLLAIIGEIIIVSLVMGMAIYVGTHLKRSKDSSVSHKIKKH